MPSRKELDKLLKGYFLSWRPYTLILQRLKEVHGVTRSLSWLKRQFRRLKLKRRNVQYTPLQIVKNCVRRELRGSNSSIGYRAMWKLLRDKYKVITKRDTVMLIMRQFDEEGVKHRRWNRLKRRVYLSKGPNFAWHMDGYDKLTPFGFHIHGCVDGFSRKIMWLRVSSNNKQPGLILNHYLQCVHQVGGCPTVLCMDRGTENSRVAAVQYAFREFHADNLAGDRSFRFGTSPANIRIECLWSHLRRHTSGWWIHVFKEMETQGLFNYANAVHRRCLAVVFLPLIEKSLVEFIHYWNTHSIRNSHHHDCLGGIPDDLHAMPNYYGTADYLKAVDPNIWYGASSTLINEAPPWYSSEFYLECAELIREEFSLDLNRDIDISNCLDVYNFLVDSFE